MSVSTDMPDTVIDPAELGAIGESRHSKRVLLVWDAPTTHVGPNTYADLHGEDPVVHGPDTDPD